MVRLQVPSTLARQACRSARRISVGLRANCTGGPLSSRCVLGLSLAGCPSLRSARGASIAGRVATRPTVVAIARAVSGIVQFGLRCSLALAPSDRSLWVGGVLGVWLPNGHVNRTAGKLRLPVRSGLRPAPAGYVER